MNHFYQEPNQELDEIQKKADELRSLFTAGIFEDSPLLIPEDRKSCMEEAKKRLEESVMWATKGVLSEKE